MKRQIFTALSLTLLISSPLMLNAGKKKKGTSHQTGDSANTLQILNTADYIEGSNPTSKSSIVSTAEASSSTGDLPSLVFALTAILPTVPTTSSESQPDTTEQLFKTEAEKLLAKKCLLLWKLKVVNDQLEKTKKPETIDLFPDVQAAMQQQDDFDKASVSSSTGHSLELPDDSTTLNNNNNTAPATTTTTTTSMPTPEPSSQTHLMWRMLGYK